MTSTAYCSSTKAFVPMHDRNCDWCGEQHPITNFIPQTNDQGTYDVVNLGVDGKRPGVISMHPFTDLKRAIEHANKFNRNYGFEPVPANIQRGPVTITNNTQDYDTFTFFVIVPQEDLRYIGGVPHSRHSTKAEAEAVRDKLLAENTYYVDEKCWWRRNA